MVPLNISKTDHEPKTSNIDGNYPRLTISTLRVVVISFAKTDRPPDWLIQMRLSYFLFVTRLPSISSKLDFFIFFPYTNWLSLQLILLFVHLFISLKTFFRIASIV